MPNTRRSMFLLHKSPCLLHAACLTANIPTNSELRNPAKLEFLQDSTHEQETMDKLHCRTGCLLHIPRPSQPSAP